MNGKALKAFVAAVVVLGLAALTLVAVRGFEGQALSALMFILLALVAGSRPVQIPGTRCRINATQPLILAALGVAGPLAAGLVAIVGVAASALGGKPPPATLKLAFNLGAVSLSAVIASACFLALERLPGSDPLAILFPLAAAAAVYFLANTGLVAAVVSVAEGQGLARTWRGSCLWTIPSYLMGLLVAAAVIIVWDSSLLWAVLLGLPPCWLLVKYYRERAASSETRAATP
jgi:hypothetical protein